MSEHEIDIIELFNKIANGIIHNKVYLYTIMHMQCEILSILKHEDIEQIGEKINNYIKKIHPEIDDSFFNKKPSPSNIFKLD